MRKAFLTIMGERIKTFVFLDTETTGLPYLEQNRTKVTEMCLTAIQAEHLDMGVFPRVQDKLSLCFNPYKYIHQTASEVSGLYNDLLEHKTRFDVKTVELINMYLSMYRSPICFVAHNGNKFDYPIIREHFHRIGVPINEEILCIDSLEAFRDLETKESAEITLNLQPPETSSSSESNLSLNQQSTTSNDSIIQEDDLDHILLAETLRIERLFSTPKKQKIREKSPPGAPVKAKRNLFDEQQQKIKPKRLSFKLGDVYERLLKKPAINAHQAEKDVEMLIACSATYGQRFTDWANTHAKLFIDIPRMEPGRKIGT